jgi:hypothetical protein
MNDIKEQVADFHVRLGRLEELVLLGKPTKTDSSSENIIEFILAISALGLCYLGFGFPNHYYQVMFGMLIVLCMYYKNTFPFPKNISEWILLVVNVAVASMLIKIIIGGGQPKPFSWFVYPIVEGGVTSFKLSWQQASISNWEIPLTVIQSFLLVTTLFGALIGFSLLSGFTSFVLILLAVPSLIDFNWTWAMPGMVAALTCFYLQSE